MRVGSVRRGLTGPGFNPASGCVEGIRRGAVERDRSIGGVASHQIDHLLEQLDLIFGLAHSTADNDALPRPSAQGIGDPRQHTVAAVEAKQAGFHTDAVLSESRHARRFALGSPMS